MKMHGTRIWWLQLVLWVGLGSLLWGCSGREGAEARSPVSREPVEVTLVQPSEQTRYIQFMGTVIGRREVAARARVSAEVGALRVAVGDEVGEGDVLVSLEAKEIEARLAQAEAQAAVAEADWQRARRLREGKAMTEQEYDAAQARHQLAQAQLREARAMAGYLEIRSPLDGQAAVTRVEAGDLVSPGQAVVELVEGGPRRLRVYLPGGYAKGLELGARAIAVVEEALQERPARLVELAPRMEEATLSRRSEWALDSGEGLLAGQTVRLLLPIGEDRGIWVDDTAVLSRGDLDYVFVERDGKVWLRLVETGESREGRARILAGLELGDRVALEAEGLSEGQPVAGSD